MTVDTYFDTSRTSANLFMSGTKQSAPTLRGSNLIAATAGGATFVNFPAGTVAGDTVVIFASSGWDWNGWPISSFEQRIEYIGGSGTPVSGWAFWFTVSSAQATAGGFTINGDASMGVNGHIAIASFVGAVTVQKLQSLRPSPTTATQVVSLGGAGKNEIFLTYGAEEANSTVSFAIGPETHQLATASFCSGFSVYTPSSRTPNETVNYGSTTPSSYSITVRITKGDSNTGLSIVSNGSNSGSVSRRSLSGKTYWEMSIDAVVGTMGPGVVAGDFNYNAQMGIDRQSLFYQSNGLVRVNNQTLATISNYVAGDIVCIAYDPGAKLVWFRVNNGSWNNDGSANPATGVGGIDTNSTSSLTSAAVFWPNGIYPGVTYSTAGGCMTAAFDDADWTYSAPSGFNSIEEVVVNGPVMNADPMGFYVNQSPEDSGDWRCRADPLPEDNHTPLIAFPAGPVKTIAGEVQEDSVGVEGRLVRLYNRRTGEFVGEARTNATGDFVIPARDPNLPHFVVAFDDDIAPDYNAKVYDNVIPQ